MSKKKKKIKETTIEDFYDLRIDKVDELVAALKGDGDENEEELSFNVSDCTGESPEENLTRRGKQKQFDPYKVDKFSRIPVWIKALFIKFWFAGAVCYFIMFGLKINDRLDQLVLTGAVLGLIVDVLVNPLFRYMESDRKEYNAYMMFPFPFKAFWTFFTNLIYYILILVCVNYCYLGLNEFINYIKHTKDTIQVGVEPLLFGVFAVACDMLFIGIKNGLVALIKKLKNKKKEGALNV
ncbi:MAG: hypothetical protein K2G38_07010 [Clostridia bacterium]|nr:hypothetical protein [Clostridia bacterium]